ncbi:MAG TPA: MFS transporter, partial [Ktedonobacterales bacterium]|nr:MFS transporter [Ktedonobacterales bacterium]
GPRLPVALGGMLSGTAVLLLTRLTPTTGYGDILWNFAMFGVGIGLMLSPITSAVMAATPPTRAGLASSMVNTSRQIGSVLGLAVLGALVENREASNLASKLETRHVPAPLSSSIANSIATAGANAGAALLQVPGRPPFPGSVLREMIGQSFAEALHPSFVTSGIALLGVALLAAALLGRGGHITTQSAPSSEQEASPAAILEARAVA